MGRYGKSLRSVVNEIARGGDRSSLFWWLVEHHDELMRAADGRRLQWASLCDRFAAIGLTDLNGKTPTAHTARITWQRARKMVAEARARQTAAAAQPKRVGATPPSRVSKDWRPSGFRQSAQSDQATPPAQPAGRLPSAPGFRSPLIDDGRPPDPTPEEDAALLNYLMGRGPKPPPPAVDLSPEGQIRRLRGEMNIRSGRRWDDPGDYAAKRADKK